MGRAIDFIKKCAEAALFRAQGTGLYRYAARRPAAGDIVVREATAADAEAIRDGGLYNMGREDVRRALEGPGPGDIWLVALKGRVVAGSVTASRCPRDAGTWTINGLVVKPWHRRQGIGERLVSELMHKAASCGGRSVVLTVNRGSFAPLRLYRKLGFKPVPPGSGAADAHGTEHLFLSRSIN